MKIDLPERSIFFMHSGLFRVCRILRRQGSWPEWKTFTIHSNKGMSEKDFEQADNGSEIRPLTWSKIDSVLSSFQPVEGGYTSARRGLIRLEDGREIFVKIGASKNTNEWASKEIRAYDFLKENNYTHIPELLAVNEGKTGFALEALRPQDGWNWSEAWDEKRLRATLAITDELAAIKPESKYAELVKPVITDNDNGWAKLMASQELPLLMEKLRESEGADLVAGLEDHIEKGSRYKLSHDTLVHDDIRADNSPWNESTGQVKLVDWNWLELGDRKVDLAALLAHVQKSGFNVLPKFADRLDPDALRWAAGLWLESGIRAIWEGGPEKLRELQLNSGITALRLAREID